jgi:hypothetical protein
MIDKEGVTLPQIELKNVEKKEIRQVQFEYKCTDSAGKDITTDLHSWAVTGADAPDDPLIKAEGKIELTVGFDESWIPAGTVRISIVVTSVEFRNGTKWSLTK